MHAKVVKYPSSVCEYLNSLTAGLSHFQARFRQSVVEFNESHFAAYRERENAARSRLGKRRQNLELSSANFSSLCPLE